VCGKKPDRSAGTRRCLQNRGRGPLTSEVDQRAPRPQRGHVGIARIAAVLRDAYLIKGTRLDERPATSYSATSRRALALVTKSADSKASPASIMFSAPVRA
jgi:hypothetical protein